MSKKPRRRKRLTRLQLLEALYANSLKASSLQAFSTYLAFLLEQERTRKPDNF